MPDITQWSAEARYSLGYYLSPGPHHLLLELLKLHHTMSLGLQFHSFFFSGLYF